VHLFERDCSVQRRNQKVVERAPAPYLDEQRRARSLRSRPALAKAANYTHAGTVEFLMDADTDKFYFIEVNPRIQVEHTVTELVTGVDIVKAQIRISEGARIGDGRDGVPPQADRAQRPRRAVPHHDRRSGKQFHPDYGRINAYRSAAGFGIRLDGGTAYSGAVITPYYDSLLVKVTAWAPTAPTKPLRRMDRALREFRIRGLSTNLLFLENVINHPSSCQANAPRASSTTTPELFKFQKRRDRATRC
jgi:pyruvate carboxylase